MVPMGVFAPVFAHMQHSGGYVKLSYSLLFSNVYFSPRRGLPSFLIFCMGSYVTKILGFREPVVVGKDPHQCEQNLNIFYH